MDTPETTEPTPSVLDRARSLGAAAMERVTTATDSGKQMLTDRRNDARRSELLQQLGALHLAVANGGDLDLPEAERLIAELAALEADDEPDA